MDTQSSMARHKGVDGALPCPTHRHAGPTMVAMAHNATWPKSEPTNGTENSVVRGIARVKVQEILLKERIHIWIHGLFLLKSEGNKVIQV